MSPKGCSLRLRQATTSVTCKMEAFWELIGNQQKAGDEAAMMAFLLSFLSRRERKGKERKGKERKGKERSGILAKLLRG